MYATRDTHGADCLSTQEGRLLPVEHCVRGTAGWQLHPAVAPLIPAGHIIDKPAFGATELFRLLAELNTVEPLEVGLCTDICVVSNALLIKAALPGEPVRVGSRRCAGVTPAKHQAALEALQSCQVAVA